MTNRNPFPGKLEDLDEFIKLFEWVLQCPSRYTSIINVVTGMTKISFIKSDK
ncbi:MAG: hypothetical protein HRT42_06115 [Campylobacteraceae bacterium]|nr:hypothetical protein [Campylobacteraceae bacterium]